MGVLPPPPSVSIDTPLAEVATVLSTELRNRTTLPMRLNQKPLKETGCALVRQADQLVGIITAADLIHPYLHTPSGLTAGDVMGTPLVTLTSQQGQDPLGVLSVCQRHGVDHLPLLDAQGDLVGLVTATSLLHSLQQTQHLKLQTVSEVMLTALPLATPNMSVLQLTAMMAEHRSSFVVVVEQFDAPVPLGFVTAGSLLIQSQQGKHLSSLTAEAVMTEPPFCLGSSDSLWFAFDEMRQRESYLLVCDRNSHLVGIVTPLRLLQALGLSSLQKTVHTLRQTLKTVEAEKLDLLRSRTDELERQVKSRTTELEQQSRLLEEELHSSRLLTATALRIQQSVGLEEILKTTVEEVRQVLQCDRTFIYSFQTDADQRLRVESVSDPNLSLKGLSVQDFEGLTHLFASKPANEIQVIREIGPNQLPLVSPEGAKRLQAKANLIIPLQDEHPWGLLIAQHCSDSRLWADWEINLMRQLATQVSIAIQKSELYSRLQTELKERCQAEQALKQTNEALEERVEERTHCWRTANQRLLLEIGERNRVEGALRQARDQLQAVFDAIPGLVSWFDANLNYLGVNRRLADAFNRAPEDFLGHPVGFLSQDNQFTLLIKRFFNSVEKAVSQEIVESINGETRHYLVAAQKYDEDQAAVCIGIDTTHSHQTAAALEKSEARFQKFVEHTNDWVWEINENLIFKYVNPQIATVAGYQPSEVLGRKFVDFMAQDEAIRFSTILQHAIAEHEPFSHLEQTLRHREGHQVFLESSGTPVFDDAGNWCGCWGISRDITERKQVELDIRRALTKERELSELKNRFISMASHEFRTPLTTILASAEALEHYRDRWSPEKVVSYLHRIQKTVAHMNGLLHDVLTVGQANAGQLRCTPTPVLLSSFCLELIADLEPEGLTPRRIEWNYRGKNTPVYADEKLLRQILGNLLSNALKYSAITARPKFQVTVSPSQTVFVIQDQGIGIPQEDLARLFEPFHRASNVGTIPGTGLGLAIVKKSVEAHGGTLEIESQEGKGTTFKVSLPLQDAGNFYE